MEVDVLLAQEVYQLRLVQDPTWGRSASGRSWSRPYSPVGNLLTQ